MWITPNTVLQNLLERLDTTHNNRNYLHYLQVKKAKISGAQYLSGLKISFCLTALQTAG